MYADFLEDRVTLLSLKLNGAPSGRWFGLVLALLRIICATENARSVTETDACSKNQKRTLGKKTVEAQTGMKCF